MEIGTRNCRIEIEALTSPSIHKQRQVKGLHVTFCAWPRNLKSSIESAGATVQSRKTDTSISRKGV